jgi:hypothetical protein
MTDRYDFDGLDFRGQGYYVFSDYEIDPARSPESIASPWEFWVAALARARTGDFSWIPRIYDLYESSEDYVFDGQCLSLLADAAPGATIDRVRAATREALESEEECDPQLLMDMAIVLFGQRSLEDVPVFVRIYERVAIYKDRVPVETYIEYLLGSSGMQGGLANVESDCTAALERHQELTELHGPGDVAIWHGEPFTIQRFAQWVLDNIDATGTPYTGRRIFEAYTGVDCRPFFAEKEFQPLTATAILEEFLTSSKAESFRADQRYFFGRPRPV